MSRRTRIVLVALATLVFVATAALAARVLTVGNAERATVLRLLRAEARGDESGVVRRVRGCVADAACRERARRVTARVRAAGAVKLLRFDGPGGVAISGRRGTARAAWKAGRAFTIVQCFVLRTRGDALRGYSVQVTSIDDPVALDASC